MGRWYPCFVEQAEHDYDDLLTGQTTINASENRTVDPEISQFAYAECTMNPSYSGYGFMLTGLCSFIVTDYEASKGLSKGSIVQIKDVTGNTWHTIYNGTGFATSGSHYFYFTDSDALEAIRQCYWEGNRITVRFAVPEVDENKYRLWKIEAYEEAQCGTTVSFYNSV